MKKLIIFISISLFFFLSCNKDKNDTSGELGGDTNIELNQVGNTFTPGTLNINGVGVNVESNIEIIESVDGVNTIRFVADLSQAPELSAFNDLIPEAFKDSEGRINVTTKVKMTSEGILDYTNSDGAPFVAVRYDDGVGTTYTLTKENGSTMTREITAKSTTDDYPWGFMYIKTTKVVQTPGIPGINKYTFWFNHRFGVVGFEVEAEDGSTLQSRIYPLYP